MSTTLLGQLNLREGRMPNYAANGKVVSPYTRLDQYQQAQETARRNAKQKAVQALDGGEIRILQRFYDQLCALVEAQRMSDPLCLMVVSKVKSLLEAGVYLHRPMLVSVVEHMAEFTKGAGLVRYNKFVLAILTFICKCVGLDVSDLEEVVEQCGVVLVVYGTPVAPSKVTPEFVASLNRESGASVLGDGGDYGAEAAAAPTPSAASAPARGLAAKGTSRGARGKAHVEGGASEGAPMYGRQSTIKRQPEVATTVEKVDMDAASKMDALAGALLGGMRGMF